MSLNRKLLEISFTKCMMFLKLFKRCNYSNASVSSFSYCSKDNPSIREIKLCEICILRNITTVLNKSVNTNELIVRYNLTEKIKDEFPWLKNFDNNSLSKKLKIISLMNFTELNHGIPFLRLTNTTLVSILKVTKDDVKNKYCTNRLYYLSKKLNCDPNVLSVKLARRTFLYTITFDWLESSLNTCLEMGIMPDRILKDLWVLRYNHATIRGRLEYVKHTGRTDLAPWMVRCPEHILERSLHISNTTSEILGSKVTTQEYLAERLKLSTECIKEIFEKIPAMKCRRVSKLKGILDFFFSEGYNEEDIINCVRILLHSLDTLKSRLEILKSLGIEVKHLNVLCKTEKNFVKYIRLLSYKEKSIR